MRLSHRVSGWVAAIAIACAFTPAHAQQPPTPDRVQYALDMTDRRIAQAEMLVAGSDNERAHFELNAAADTQGRAKSAFSASQLRIALGLTLEARGHADRAIAIVRGLPDPDRVLAQLQRTRELLERARDRIEECNIDRAHSLIQVAFAMQERAETAAANGRFLAALQLSMGARERGLRSLRMCHMEENIKDSAERALNRTDEVIARARGVAGVSTADEARRALSQAAEFQARAQGEFQNTHFDAALRLTQSARTLALRALRLSGRR
jgi:hypothetical protein